MKIPPSESPPCPARRAGLLRAGGLALLASAPLAAPQLGTPPRVPRQPHLPSTAKAPETHGAWRGPWTLRERVTGASLGASPCCSWSGFSHAVLLATGDRAGQVLLWDYLGLYGIWDPASPDEVDGTLWFTRPVPCDLDIFCSGHTALSDGRILFAGGGFGSGCDDADCAGGGPAPAPRASVIFDPAVTDGSVDPWVPGPDMAFRRYYPTAVTMTKAFGGRALVLGGTQEAGNAASTVTPWERLVPGAGAGASCQSGVLTPWTWETLADPSNPMPLAFYPRAFQLSHPDGRFLLAGETAPTGVEVDANPPGACWYLTPPPPGGTSGTLTSAPPELERYYGSAVLLHQLPENGGLDRVLVFGGTSGAVGPTPGGAESGLVVHDSVSEFRFRPGPPDTSDWLPKAPLTEPRAYSNAVVLPTGEVFVSRGSSTDPHHGHAAWRPQLHAELYDPGDSITPGGGSTRRVARIPAPFPARVYHSVALLLPDGRVLVAGGDQVPGGPPSSCNTGPQCGRFGTSAHSVEVFEPPYLFQGLSVSIVAAPSTLDFDQAFQVEVAFGPGPASSVDRVVLIKPGSNTHHLDFDQRYVELAFAPSTGGAGASTTLDVTAPSPRLGPPGRYLLFVVTTDGDVRVPSEGRFVTLR